MSADYESEFRSIVLGWVQAHQAADAIEVTRVGGEGTDWEGDTEGGFYSTFHASIRYRTADGTERIINCVGDDMGSLWDWVIKGNRS